MTINLFYMETLLSRQLHLLGVETGQIGHFSIKLCQPDRSIDFVCKQYGFLLMHPLLVGTYLDKQVFASDSCPSITHLHTAVFVMHVGTCIAILAGSTRHLQVNRARNQLMPCYTGMRTTYSIVAGLLCVKSICKCYRRETACMSIYNLNTRLLGSIWTGDDFKPCGNACSAEIIYVLSVNRV